MEWNSDQLSAIIGSLYLQTVELRLQLAQANARIHELTPKPPTEKPNLEVVDGAS